MKRRWDQWYSILPQDIKEKLSPHDLKRIGDCFKIAFSVDDDPYCDICSTNEDCQINKRCIAAK